MSNYALRLPESLKQAAKRIAATDDTTMNQFFVVAIAEKISAMETAQFFEKRAASASTPAAQAAFPQGDHFAFDWTFSAATLLHGTHIELPQTLMRRELTARERYVGYVNRDNSGMLDRLFPLLPMTRALLYEKRVPHTIAVYRALAFANLEYHLARANKYHTVYSKLAGPLLRRVLWRI